MKEHRVMYIERCGERYGVLMREDGGEKERGKTRENLPRGPTNSSN